MIISNNMVGKMPIEKDTIIRINLAWIKSYEEAVEVITSCKNEIYLDYPQGRTKPPVPVITLDEAIELSKFDNIKYFAVSNIETVEQIDAIRNRLGDIEFVPKIETKKGVLNLDEIIDAGIKTIMLDKEDLYTDVNANQDEFNELVEIARSKDIKVLELKGVIFD